MAPRPDAVYRRRADAPTASLGEELAVLDLPTGSYLGFNATAAHAWRLLDKPQSLDSLCAAMRAEFNVAPERCRAEVERLIEKLLAARLIEADA